MLKSLDIPVLYKIYGRKRVFYALYTENERNLFKVDYFQKEGNAILVKLFIHIAAVLLKHFFKHRHSLMKEFKRIKT